MKKTQTHNEVVEPQEPIKVAQDTNEIESDSYAGCKEELAQMNQRYLRALADCRNLENRIDQERGRMRQIVTRQVVTSFIPVLDHLELALQFTKDQGLQSVMKLFSETLTRFGLSEMDLIGKEYDPHSAEVIEIVPGKVDDVVCEVVQKAYKADGEVVRPGKVKVAKKQSQS